MLSFSDQESVLKEILKRKSNYNCADCTTISPTWASLDFGVFLCSNCSGAHRSLGPTVTRVRSTKLDKWQADWIDLMQVGNVELNAYCNDRKPTSIASLDEVKRFVVQKYIKKRFVPKGAEKADARIYHKNLKVQKQPINSNQVSNNVCPRQQQSNCGNSQIGVDLLFDCDNNASGFSNNANKSVNNPVPIEDDDEDFGNFTDGGVVENFNGNTNITQNAVSGSTVNENSNLSFDELMNQNRQKEEQKRMKMQQMKMGMYNYQVHSMNLNMNMTALPYNNFSGIGNNASIPSQHFTQHNPLQNYNYIQPNLHKSHSMGNPSHSGMSNQDGWSNWQ